MITHVFDDRTAAANSCAHRIADLMKQIVASKSRVTLALSGGSTPGLMFEELARQDLTWTSVHIFQVDERLVPPTDENSNYHLIREKLIEPAGIPSANVHRICGELPGADAAARYTEELRTFFALGPRDLPVFDMMHRGMGEEGHTASLFPGDPAVMDVKGIAAVVHVPKPPPDRVTLLPGVLVRAAHTLMLVAGSDKAEALHAVLKGPVDVLRYPAQLAARDGLEAEWFLDRAAARLLDE
ncbi:MAG TPA: 6-phosphogluconolactonase [Bryobacteraceae bacterium]|nr:6-phosphogluconolactonase [Bryobacteraceae bacterium]